MRFSGYTGSYFALRALPFSSFPLSLSSPLRFAYVLTPARAHRLTAHAHLSQISLTHCTMQLISLFLLVSSALAAPHIGPRKSHIPFAGTPAAFRTQGPSRTFARPSGPPPTSAQLIAQAAGTFDNMGFLLKNGTFQPTYDEDKDAATVQRLREEPAPFWEIETVATENDRIFTITSLKGENGFCGMDGANLSCSFEEPQSGLRLSSTTYGWELTVGVCCGPDVSAAA